MQTANPDDRILAHKALPFFCPFVGCHDETSPKLLHPTPTAMPDRQEGEEVYHQCPSDRMYNRVQRELRRRAPGDLQSIYKAPVSR